MKLGIFSDTHFGFAEKTERQNESFENGLNALKICCEKKVDAIIFPGDVFDEPFPSPETLSKAFDVFSHSQKQPKSSAKVTLVGKHGENEFDFSGIPIIAIHGNHDYSGINRTNILEVFSKSGFLGYVGTGKAFIEKDGERVCVFGFSSVPEKKALDVLKLWNPVPEKGCTNILMMHQSFKEFIPFMDDMIASLSLDDLPQGFDIVVNGHLHWTDVQKLSQTIFLLAGSTVTTQMKKLEAEREKGVFVFDTNSKSLEFFPLPNQRKLFYHKLKFENAKPAEILAKSKECLENSLLENSGRINPLVRIKIEGSLALGVNSSDVDLSELFSLATEKAFLSVSKNFFSLSFKKKIEDLRNQQKSRQSIASLGFELLEKNLAETDFAEYFDTKQVFDLLEQGELDEAQKAVVK